MQQTKTKLPDRLAHMESAAPSDSFFTPIGNTKPYFKAAFQGGAGSGKTYTAALVAIGIHKRIGSKKPIVIFDTEKASKFLVPLFVKNKIQGLVRESKSLADLKTTMQRMRMDGISDILMIDSITHVWQNVLKSYQEKVGRSLNLRDWGIIKPTWAAEFSDPFVQDPYHIMMTGRVADVWGQEENEDGRKELVKTGVKMKVEGETAYEPDVVVQMEQGQEMKNGRVVGAYRQATILKDRSTVINDKIFRNPTYENFAPAIEVMLDNPMPRDAIIAPEQNAGILFKTEEDKYEWRRNRDKAIEEIDGLLSRIAPGSVGKDKQMKLELLDKVFGTTSTTALGEIPIEILREGYGRLMDEAVALGVAEYVKVEGKTRIVPVAGNAKS